MYKRVVPAGNDTAFRAISDPTRREILRLLGRREHTVTELAQHFRVSQPAISQHLAKLRHANLVKPRRVSRCRYYRLNPRPLRQVADWVAYFEQFWDDKLDQLGTYLESSNGQDD